MLAGCCCAQCKLCEDDFGRTDSSDVDTGSACGWTESSGAWEIDSGELVCTSAGTILSGTEQLLGDAGSLTEVQFKADSSSAIIDVQIARQDANNYLRARYSFDDQEIQLYVVRDGVETLEANTAVTLSTATWYTAKVCRIRSGDTLVGEVFTASLDGTIKAGTVFSNGTVWTSGQTGLAASGFSSEARFDNFSFKQAYGPADTSCPTCFAQKACGACTSNMGSSITVTLTGLSDQGCTGCTDLNDVPVCLPFRCSYVAEGGSWVHCVYWKRVDDISDCINYIFAEVTDAGDNDVHVVLFHAAYRSAEFPCELTGDTETIDTSDTTSDLDCANWEDVAFSNSVVDLSPHCNWTGQFTVSTGAPCPAGPPCEGESCLMECNGGGFGLLVDAEDCFRCEGHCEWHGAAEGDQCHDDTCTGQEPGVDPSGCTMICSDVSNTWIDGEECYGSEDGTICHDCIALYGTDSLGRQIWIGPGDPCEPGTDPLSIPGFCGINEPYFVRGTCATEGGMGLMAPMMLRVPSEGPGSEFKALVESLGIAEVQGCDCPTLRKQMNWLGVEGCRDPENREKLIAALRRNQAKRERKRKAAGESSRWEFTKAAALSVVRGVAFKLNPLDPLPGLFDEAVRRAGAKA